MKNELEKIHPLPIRVLIVESHELIMWGLNKLINGRQPEMEVVGTSSNVAEAIPLAMRLAPDVVLLSDDMVRALGCEDWSRTMQQAGARTLLFTDDLSSDSFQLSLQAGAHGLLTRKSSPEEVIKAVSKTYYGELWFGREATGMALEAMREPGRKASTGATALNLLTARERKVLLAVVENRVRTNKDLARRLFISESTLRNHLSSIYRKFGVTNRLDLYVFVHDQGIRSKLSEYTS